MYMTKIKEKDIQEHIYRTLKRFPKKINFQAIKTNFSLNKYDIVNNPLKYILNKNYNYFHDILDDWDRNYEDFIYKFPREYNTAEKWSSKPKIDILVNHNNKEKWETNFLIFEIKNDFQPERQTITELLQYSNWLQTQDFPWLENDKIWLIIIAKDWSNILIQSVINLVLFKWIKILPIKLDHNWKNIRSIKLSILDIYNFDFIKKIENNIINKSFYKTRSIAFDEERLLWDEWIKTLYNDQKIISMLISKELEKRWYNWFVFFSEYEEYRMYWNCIFIMTFDWLSFDIKNWKSFSDKKAKILFELDINYEFDTSIIWDIVKKYYLNSSVSFEEWNDWDTFEELSSSWFLFSYWTSFWFLNILHNDLIKYLIDDINFRIEVTWTDDISENEIFSRQLIDNIFNYKWNKLQEELDFYNLKIEYILT